MMSLKASYIFSDDIGMEFDHGKCAKATFQKEELKTTNSVVFDADTVIKELDQTVNREFNCDVLKRVRENIQRKQPDLWSAKNWILQDRDALCYRALITRKFLAKNMLSLPHPPYSPDLTPVDFHLFLKRKMQLKGCRFNIAVEIQSESLKVLNSFTGNKFQARFQEWQER
ncbi:histone-lysine N-methyltransferase SETMAR-like [Octopus sinensis]|uniref:Histone-lysine N-methyltransferase SETMAR-like n=1 Tax=Octopus sinensis TaxID=2607531 RepID=A0A6P7TM74_9MOLL|nr:histone-lysine N-methyltransferase SETMAR-like [Octopus sinensis]